MKCNKTVEINYFEDLPYKIVWICEDKKNFNSETIYKRNYLTDKIRNISVKNDEIMHFSVANYLNNIIRFRNEDFCKKIGTNFWKINSIENITIYIQEDTQKCFDKDLFYIGKKYYRVFQIYLYWAKLFLSKIKIDTYYDKIFYKKVIVYNQDKPFNYQQQIYNFLLCCKKVEFLPELIPEVLKFICFV